jgi:hypothetical protein
MSDTKNPFFSTQNEAMLDRILYNDFQRRIGGDLNEKQKERLVKTVRHYMNEVYEEKGEQPVPIMNKEVLAAVVPDYLSYLRRGQISSEERTRVDVGTRFNQLQNERQEVRPTPPAMPDFRIAGDEESSTALTLFEQVKKQREDDASRVAAANTESRVRGQDSINRSVSASMEYDDGVDAARKRDELALIERNMSRQSAAKQVNLSLPPDPRAFFFGGTSPGALRDDAPLAQANPTLALPDSIRTRPSLPQDSIKKQDDIVTYRENEYNLFLYSADRNWVANSTENRYNFSVNFDPANNRPGFGFSTAANIKFKNIVRIELVKVIVPTEGIDILALQDTSGGYTNTCDYNTSININALSFPYLMLNIPELDTNNFGTNTNIDNAFGIVQYDANWISDNTANNRGYLAMIPKFMKCQKVYYPTPLATLQKLTIQLRQPNGDLVSDSLDTLDISGFLFSSQLSSNPSGANISYAKFADTSGAYIWIQTSTWFSQFMVSQADRVVFQNIAFPSSYTGTQASADFLNFLQRKKGHVVVGTGHYEKNSNVVIVQQPIYTRTVYTNTYFKALPNVQGYCNYIIIRNFFNDPTTGSTALGYYGGTSATNTAFVASLPGVSLTTGRFINMNHQTQVVLRVITRDMDSASRLRPDNNF